MSGGTSQPVPGCRRYALLRLRMPLSPSRQRSRQRRISPLAVPGSRPKKVGEVVARVVELRRKVVGLRLALLADQGGLLIVLVHVMGNRPHVVEELAVH